MGSFHYRSAKLFLVLFLTSMAGQAGVRDSGGLPLRPSLPQEDFAYLCDLELHEVGTNNVSIAKMKVDRKLIDLNSMGLDIPKELWTHGTREESLNMEFKPTERIPRYSFAHHFLGFSFAKNDLGQWQVQFRVNLIFKDKEAGAATFVLADFQSKILGARIVAEDPTRKETEKLVLDMNVVCLKK